MSSYAENLNIPKRSHKVCFFFKWKGKGSYLNRGKNYVEVAKIYGKNKSICEIRKKVKEIHASLLRERNHIHITFIAVYCYKCSILLLLLLISSCA